MWNSGDEFPHSQYAIPTDEDVLDVNFWAIVSDLRGIIRGTIVPRSWDDISTTWHYIPHPKKRGPDKSHVYRLRINERNRLRSRVNKLAKILHANGMSPVQAHSQAERILTKGAN